MGKLIWKRTGRIVSKEGSTTIYHAAGKGIEIESRKRHIPHANGVGTWDHTTYWVKLDGKDVIVFEDLDSAESEGKPIEVVVFLVDPARLTALMQLAAFSKTTPGPAALMPYGHACQQIYAIPRAEGESDDPHAVVGMTDMYARRFIAKDLLSFAVPYKLYKRMDSDLDESFLTTGKFRLNMDKCI